MKKIMLILSLFSLFSCSENVINDIIIEPQDKSISVLVIGNSITHSAPSGEWEGDWGMAATSAEKDFCGVIKSSLELEGFKIDLDKKNIAVWERDFSCEINILMPPITKHYDYIIIKLGENVPDNSETFEIEFEKLTRFYSNFGRKIILVTTVWRQYSFTEDGIPYEVPPMKDIIIRRVSINNDYDIADISDIKENQNYFAWYEYENTGIGSHPNDLGMEFIANKILQKIPTN